ncbi:MAG: replication-relaxation family protein [Pseudomonadota bacterium]
MKDSQTDSLGRATFHRIPERIDVRPSARALRWFKHIQRHGPQSSELLYEATRDTHRCKDTALRDLQKLRAGGYLRLPRQQRQTERAEFNPYIYDLTPQAKRHLRGLGQDEPTIRPTGHWWHGYLCSAFTGSLDIFATRQDRTYIPAHTILARSDADLAIPLPTGRIVPDQLFAVRYEQGFRAYLLEVDRGTEPVSSQAARKSLATSIDQYVEVFSTELHRDHYGLRASTSVLWVFTCPARRTRFRELVAARAGPYAAYFLTKVLPARLGWAELAALHERSWLSGTDRMVQGL